MQINVTQVKYKMLKNLITLLHQTQYTDIPHTR